WRGSIGWCCSVRLRWRQRWGIGWCGCRHSWWHWLWEFAVRLLSYKGLVEYPAWINPVTIRAQRSFFIAPPVIRRIQRRFDQVLNRNTVISRLIQQAAPCHCRCCVRDNRPTTAKIGIVVAQHTLSNLYQTLVVID